MTQISKFGFQANQTPCQPLRNNSNITRQLRQDSGDSVSFGALKPAPKDFVSIARDLMEGKQKRIPTVAVPSLEAPNITYTPADKHAPQIGIGPVLDDIATAAAKIVRNQRHPLGTQTSYEQPTINDLAKHIGSAEEVVAEFFSNNR